MMFKKLQREVGKHKFKVNSQFDTANGSIHPKNIVGGGNFIFLQTAISTSVDEGISKTNKNADQHKQKKILSVDFSENLQSSEATDAGIYRL